MISVSRALIFLSVLSSLGALLGCSTTDSDPERATLDHLRSMEACDAMVSMHERVVEANTRVLPEDRTLALEYWKSVWAEADTVDELRASCALETLEVVSALGLRISDDPFAHRLPRYDNEPSADPDEPTVGSLRALEPCEAIRVLHELVVAARPTVAHSDEVLALEYWTSVWPEAGTQRALQASCPTTSVEVVEALGLELIDDPSRTASGAGS